MSVMFKIDEDCIDAAAFDSRNFSADVVMKLLYSMGPDIEECVLPETLYDAYKEQMSSLFDEYVYSIWGKVKILRGQK